MPYEIEEQDGRFCVVKTEPERETMKCYDDKAEAQDYLAALDTNVEEAALPVEEEPEDDKKPGMMDKAIATIRALFQKPAVNFAVYKDVNGKPRWIGKFTNNFRDRSREIISEKAFDGYLTRLEYGLVPMPELELGHIPGSKHGVADDVFAVGNFVVAVGSFDETEFAQKCVRYYEKNAPRIQMSHGFIHPEWAFKDGVYDVINIFEVSTLPPPLVAANPYTEFEVTDMKQIRPEQLEALALVVGSKEKAESLVAQWSQESEELKAIGVAYKDFADVEAAQMGEKSAEKSADLNEVFLNVIEDLGTTFKLQRAMNDELAKVKADVIADVKAEVAQALAPVQKALTDALALIEALKADRAAAPRIATEDASTALKLTPEQEEKLKQQLPETNGFDPFFGDLKVRKS